MARIPSCYWLDVLILGPKRNLDHRSFFCLVWYVNELIQIISVFEQSLFKLMHETVIGIVLRYNHQASCLLYYLCEITSNNGIHLYLSRCICGFGLDILVEKRHGSADLYAPLYPSPPPFRLVLLIHLYFNICGCLLYQIR